MLYTIKFLSHLYTLFMPKMADPCQSAAQSIALTMTKRAIVEHVYSIRLQTAIFHCYSDIELSITWNAWPAECEQDPLETPYVVLIYLEDGLYILQSVI